MTLAEISIRKLNFPRTMTGAAVGRSPGSFHLRIVRSLWGKVVSLERPSFNEGIKYSVNRLKE